ncbi:hypothetical protein SJ05684_c32280 [Sinorhizobium sojae CCBAU 05684]|uniref:Phage protein n=1 Tax=Sinorhizobium sojae CCBAU 05684 TaxID=716928 RepID=A0A249PFB9_9HYPH|nr:hypothetical protein [Sinorhizobium sojae]ASY64650.1 hypothetical protein SJ05684_c32280 [Sinorhizobium sojae CCBAU 05684]
MAKKRDDDLRRLKAEFPDVHDALLAGRIPSPRKALVLAGLKPERSRLEKLKNSWAKATEAERDAFLAWLGAIGALPESAAGSRSAGARPGETPIASGRYLLPAAIAEIRATMARRKITPDDVMHEMGFAPDGRPLARALGRHASLRLAVIAALERWLRENAGA